MKKVLVISTSPRKNSNSEMLADEFLRGAQDAGHEAEKLSLRGADLRFCRGCMACIGTGRCPIADDVADILRRMHDADVIAFATPIYYFEMSGQMKTLLDRCNPLYGGDYRFTDIYLLTAAAEDAPDTPERARIGLTGWVDCFPRASLCGTAFAGGVGMPGEAANHPALREAYELGRSV